MSYNRRYYRPRETLPSKHDHAGNMLWQDDFACCRVCEQAWAWTERGWKALPRKKVPQYER